MYEMRDINKLALPCLHERTSPTAVWMDVVEYMNYTPHTIYKLL